MPIPSHSPGPTDARDRYFFHLNGCIHIQQALSDDEVDACNRTLDRYQHVQPGEWKGWVHGHTYGAQSGVNLQQIFEADEAFERLMDHPSWFDKLREFIGSESNLEYCSEGSLSLYECHATIRSPGQAIPMHSGGHSWWHRDGMFTVRDGRFRCSEINVLIALTNIGPGDGGTMLVPASHKVELPHPDLATKEWGKAMSMEGVEGAIEIAMRAGDALIFCDPVVHGSAARTNPGQRRTALYRYSPSYMRPRYPYRSSPELLARLTPARRHLVQPVIAEFAPPVAVV